MKTISLGVVMDPIGEVHVHKDTTMALLLEAQRRVYQLFYFEQTDLFLQNGIAYGSGRALTVYDREKDWYTLSPRETICLADLDIILMRKDPPVDKTFIETTYILESAERQGVRVLNKPQSLRDANEKVFATQFPQCTPETMVTSQHVLLKMFLQQHKKIVCKPLDGMGGRSIFLVESHDANVNVIFDTLTKSQTQNMMVQAYIPDIVKGDKRIILINGKPHPFCLARVPGEGEWRGNLAAGAKGVVQPLSDRDKWICDQVGPTLQEKGLFFVGLDVIGDYLTEVNVTSPTGVRELDASVAGSIKIVDAFFDALHH